MIALFFTASSVGFLVVSTIYLPESVKFGDPIYSLFPTSSRLFTSFCPLGQKLSKAGVKINTASQESVLATLRIMGVDFDKIALVEREPFRAAFGKNADLYLVPEKHRDLFYQAVGGSSPPAIFIIDRKGKLRYAGYPMEDSVTKLVETLLGDERSD